MPYIIEFSQQFLGEDISHFPQVSIKAQEEKQITWIHIREKQTWDLNQSLLILNLTISPSNLIPLRTEDTNIRVRELTKINFHLKEHCGSCFLTVSPICGFVHSLFLFSPLLFSSLPSSPPLSAPMSSNHQHTSLTHTKR